MDSIYHNVTGVGTCNVVAIASTPTPEYVRLQAVVDNMESNDFMCELGGHAIPLQGTSDQMRELTSLMESGQLVSAESYVEVSSIDADESKKVMRLPPGKVIVKEKARKKRGGGDRILASNEVAKPVLVVRVTDSGGRVHTDTPDIISDNVFGTYGDAFTMKSQLEACSYGRFVVSNSYSIDISRHLSAPGVIDVDLPISLTEHDKFAVADAAQTAAEEKLGISLPERFKHVLFVLEKCYIDCGWSAWAYVNSWLSVYSGDAYAMPSVGLHEIGHNLDMGHSGMDGPYGDRTGALGEPIYQKDEGAMCFNAAKTYQLARSVNWYNQDSIVEFDSDTNGSWAGRVIGVAEYQNNPHSWPLVVKLESGTPNDLFVGFNRFTGINVSSRYARDMVTIVEAGNDGLGYSQSTVRAVLSQGDTYTIPDFRLGGYLTISVKQINLQYNPGYADIAIAYNTPSPTYPPTSLAPSYSVSALD